MAGKRTPTKRAKPRARKRVPKISPAEAARRQTMIVELVALVVVPGYLERAEAERIARKVVADHPGAWTGELVPMVIAHVERTLLEAA